MDKVSTYVFLDTNLLLHFKRPDQIDWAGVAGTQHITLVIAPVILRELEEQKVKNPSKQIRERASNIVKWLDALLDLDEKMEIRSNTRLNFLVHDPVIDFRGHHLSQQISDDVLIASAIEFREAHPCFVLIATADTGLKVKLRAHGLGVLRLPEEYGLAPESDPTDLALRRTRAELEALKTRMPRLRATFQNGQDHLIVKKRNSKTIDVEAELYAEKTKYQRPAEDTLYHGINLARYYDASIGNLDKYFREYKIYLEAKAQWAEMIGLRYKLLFSLYNDGTTPASNIDTILQFPDHLRLEEPDDVPKAPTKPHPPGTWGNGGIDLSSLLKTPSYNFNTDGEPFISDRNKVRFPLSSLKHGFTKQFKSIYLVFQNMNDITSHSIRVEISAAELPKPVVQKLHVVVEG